MSTPEPPPASEKQNKAESIPHSLGGFRGGFYSMHNRHPTDQEICNAAVKSAIDLYGLKKTSI